MSPPLNAIAHNETPADGLTLVEQAYQQIRSRILDNVWAPGYQALEQQVALALGMSRTPVREALIRLQQEGLVEVAPRRGMRVLPVSPEDMREIYQILTALECLAAELLAKSAPTATQLAPLVVATQAMELALAQDKLEEWARADENFHRELVRLCGNKSLLDAMMNYWDRAHRARMFSLRLRPKPVNSTREHMQLVERLLAADAAGAAQVNRSHRERASRELLEIFAKFQIQQM
jgi:DNA-binding GntR family transcriptional regulator